MRASPSSRRTWGVQSASVECLDEPSGSRPSAAARSDALVAGRVRRTARSSGSVRSTTRATPVDRAAPSDVAVELDGVERSAARAGSATSTRRRAAAGAGTIERRRPAPASGSAGADAVPGAEHQDAIAVEQQLGGRPSGSPREPTRTGVAPAASITRSTSPSTANTMRRRRSSRCRPRRRRPPGCSCRRTRRRRSPPPAASVSPAPARSGAGLGLGALGAGRREPPPTGRTGRRPRGPAP